MSSPKKKTASGATRISTKGRQRSIMWAYFSRVPNHPTAVTCKICNSRLHIIDGTGNLHKHVRCRHPVVYDEAMIAVSKKKPPPPIESLIPVGYEETVGARVGTTSEQTEFYLEMMRPKKRGPERHSVVWEYFEDVEPGKVQCKLCGIIIKFVYNGIFKHLSSLHPGHHIQAMAKRRVIQEAKIHDDVTQATFSIPSGPSPKKIKMSCSSETTIPSAVPEVEVNLEDIPSSSSTGVSQLPVAPMPAKKLFSEKLKDRVNKLLMKLITVNLLPPSIVEMKEFQEILRVLDSRYQLPTKKTVLKTLLPDLALEIKSKLKSEIDMASHFALTVETWKYRRSQNCMTVTAHFIKEAWDTSSVVLETIDSPEESNSESVIEEMRRITDEWGISDKVTSLGSHQSGLLSTVALTMGWEHLFCFGEKLNQVILTALQSVPDVTRILKKVNEAADYFDQNLKATEVLLSVQQQHSIPECGLKTEVENKWITTYHVMRRMSEQFEAANTVLCHHGRDAMCLCDEEVELMRSIANVLMLFEAIVTEFSSVEYPSMSQAIPLRNVLQEVVANSAEDSIEPSASLSSFRDFLVQQMESQFDNLERNSTLAVCTLLDPRFKHHAFTDESAMEAAKEQLLQEMTSLANTKCSTSTEESIEDASIVKEEIKKKTHNTVLSSIWNAFDKRVSQAGAKKSVSSQVENESHRYFKEALLSRDEDPLEWWKLNKVQYPHLHVLARKYLCIPAISVCSSRLFSKKSEEFNCRRNKIKPSDLDTLLFLSSNVYK